MADDRLRGRITAQFSDRGERADIWRALGLVVETDAFLNLGYSEWYRPHILGGQRRLVTVVGQRLSERLPATEGTALLDIGCGRGGPASHLSDRFGFDVRGVDLVAYNVARARENAPQGEFVVGDATRLPFQPGSMAACTAIDVLVYLPDRRAVLAELADVLEPGGVVVVTDLVRRPDANRAQETVADFADAWDMPPPGTVADDKRALESAGFEVCAVEDITAHSVGQFRTWTTLFLSLYATPLGRLLDRLLARKGVDPATVVGQIRRAHEALPALGHALVVARR